jgi:hypothetical protein
VIILLEKDYLIGKGLFEKNLFEKEDIIEKNTYSSTQCPAVATQSSLMSAPPHLWVELNKI